VPGGGLAGAEVGDVSPSEGMLVDRAPAGFHAALFRALPDSARGHGTAMVRGTGQVWRIAYGGFAPGALQDGGLEVVAHDLVRNAPKAVQGVLVAGEQVVHRL